MTAHAVRNHGQAEADIGVPGIFIMDANQAAMAQALHLESARNRTHCVPYA
jgi:hypothetical protein